jgi:DNA-binding response OmpR family regulator
LQIASRIFRTFGMARICNIVVVESHEGVRGLVGEALEAHGFHIRLVANGREMREAISGTKCDIVIIDLSSCEGDGLTLAEAAAHCGASVILTTAEQRQFGDVETSGHRYMLKPFMMPELLALVREVADEIGCARRKARRRPA